MDNKIKIPWYKFNPKMLPVDSVQVNQPDFDLDINRKKPKNKTRGRGRVPVTEPVRVPVTSPVAEPSPFKVPQPDIGTNPYKVPDANPFGFPVPLPIPKPNPDMQKKPSTPSYPVPAFTEGWVQDWMRETGTSTNKNPNQIQEPTTSGTGNKIVDSVLGGALSLVVAQKVAETTVNATLTDPIYAKMIETPVLGAVMKEAEKADVDMSVVATYFANYDYANFDANKMTKELSGIVGIASAIRMVAYFTARAITVK